MAVDHVRASGRTARTIEEPSVFASEGTLLWFCSWRWTESVPWAHCPKSYPPVLFASRRHTALALLFGGVDRVRAVGALPEELYQFCQCGRTALACSWQWTESVPVGALPEELLVSAGEGALPWQLRVLEAKPSPSTTMTWIRGTWRLAQATPPSKLSRRWAIDPGGCPQ